jgi:hypothetical protein
MNVNRIMLRNMGQIEEADLTFGDLTVFVGPQATGKSIALQMLKLLIDRGIIIDRLKTQGVDWNKELNPFLDAFLGEGMRAIWKDNTEVMVDEVHVDIKKLIRGPARDKSQSLFYIPAQRVMTLRDGWPRPFSEYGPGDPFVVRDFSEQLRLLMELQLGQSKGLFPKSNRLKKPLRDAIDQAVFHGFGLSIDRTRPQKRLVLRSGENGKDLPYMVWSAGQREFVPLLLGLYWLLPPAKVKRRHGIKWVVIEELEMGLHPRAIHAVIMLVLDLLWRGYKVCLSTHSPQVLDILWAFRVFKEKNGTERDVLGLFGMNWTQQMQKVAATALAKEMKAYYFEHRGPVKEISKLDPGAEDPGEAGWGGLTEFNGRVNSVVSDVVSRSEKEARA